MDFVESLPHCTIIQKNTLLILLKDLLCGMLSSQFKMYRGFFVSVHVFSSELKQLYRGCRVLLN